MKKILITTITLLWAICSYSQVNYNQNIIKGEHASAIGQENASLGKCSFSTGINSTAGGDYSFSAGKNVSSKGMYSNALGWDLMVGGYASFSLGYGNSATGNTSGVLGSLSTATGTASMAFGNKVDAIMPYSIVIGKGVHDSHLTNNISSSLMIGFESDIPTFFVGGASGSGTLGKIGIGTITPGSRLQLNGNLAIGYSEQTAAPENGLCVSGNVGIGTDTPTEKLHIEGSVKLSSIKLPDGTEIASKADLGKWEDCPNGISYAQGFIGIGSAAPSSPLSIKGHGNNNELIGLHDINGTEKWRINLKMGGLNIAGANGLDYGLFIQEGGNVGLGTHSPKAQFQVGSDNGIVALGSSTGQDLNWGVSYIGFNATRDPITKVWRCNGDGSHNGGAVIYATIYDGLYISAIPNSGSGSASYTDADIKNFVQLRLSPNGKLRVKEVEVLADLWPDYVFEDSYQLKSLDQVESFIKENKHLAEIPPEKTVKENGINLGQMDALLLKKIEELTLYTIEQHKQLKMQQEQIEKLQNQINEMKN